MFLEISSRFAAGRRTVATGSREASLGPLITFNASLSTIFYCLIASVTVGTKIFIKNTIEPFIL